MEVPLLYNGRFYSHNTGAIETMSKRFTDTELWNEDWFVELTNDQKLFWFYVKDACNHAGIWKVNKRHFESTTGIKIDLEKFFKLINSDKERIVKITNDKWYLNQFVIFHYGKVLNENNNAHFGVLKELRLYNIDTCDFEVKDRSNTLLFEVKERSKTVKGDPNKGPKDKDKDKDIRKGGVGGKEKFIKPSVGEVIMYFAENGYPEELGRKAFNYYDVAGWKDSKGNQVKNWKQKCQAVWFKEENKAKVKDTIPYELHYPR
jgi:hypothetical protein